MGLHIRGQKSLQPCPKCKSPVLPQNMAKHLRKIHNQLPISAPPVRTQAIPSVVLQVTTPPKPVVVAPKLPATPSRANLENVGLFAPELWGRPIAPGALLKRFTVIAPYPTEGFFERIRETLRPEQLLLVVDDGCSIDEVDAIRGLFEGQQCTVRYASCSGYGLVHAKLYLAEWKTTEPGASVSQLAWGSANPSLNGFHCNAEAVSFVPLSSASDILGYFRQLWDNRGGKVFSLSTSLPGGIRLLLPGFTYTSKTESETFDAWIQSGRLCHKYEPDQSFAKLQLSLKKPLPSNDLRSVFSQAGLTEETNSQTFRYAYCGEIVNTEADKDIHLQWRSQYFVETWLGFWTSGACYRERGDEFAVRDVARRKELLRKIREADESIHQGWVDEFLRRICQVLTGLQKIDGLQPQDYLEMKRGVVDVGHYRAEALDRLGNHQKRARIPAFAERYTKGYEFPPLPRFRGAEAEEGGSFREYVDGLCESLLNGLSKQKTSNRIARSLRNELSRLGRNPLEMDGEKLHEFMQRHWQDIGRTIKPFYSETA